MNEQHTQKLEKLSNEVTELRKESTKKTFPKEHNKEWT